MGESIVSPKGGNKKPSLVEIVGISGSPVKNSSTDRLVKLVLDSTGLKSEFIKLSNCTIEACNACMIDDPKWGRIFPCQLDNQCTIRDDFQKIRPKLLGSDALVIGGYPSYGSVDARTKTFLERLFSLDHCAFRGRPLMTGKLGVSIAVCNNLDDGKTAAGQIEHMYRNLRMIPIAKIVAQGSFPCRFRRECRVRHLEPVPLTPPEGIVRDPLSDEGIIKEAQTAARIIRETLEIRRKDPFTHYVDQ